MSGPQSISPDSAALADEFTKWVERYALKVCPEGCLPTVGQEREINLFARIAIALRATQPAAHAGGESDRFEAWVKSRGGDVMKRDGIYLSSMTRLWWECWWQAASPIAQSSAAIDTPLSPCTQTELDAFEGLNSNSKRLFQMWVDRALKAEVANVAQAVPDRAAIIEECARMADGWLAIHGDNEIQYTSPREYASDAVADIADAIRAPSLPSTQSDSAVTRPHHHTPKEGI